MSFGSSAVAARLATTAGANALTAAALLGSASGASAGTPAQQLFVAVNLERTERGLAPATVLSKSLSRGAQAGARAGRDPAMGSVPRRLPGGGRMVSAGATWSGGWINPLGADYAWRYDDGPPADATFTWTKAKKLLGLR